MLRIIYIAGSGRSGSTLLERVLNSAPSTFALGEFSALWRLEMKDLVCSCGERMPACSFWSEMIKATGIGDREIAYLRKLERTVVRTPYLLKKRFDLSQITSDRGIREFISIQDRLFGDIAKLSGAETLIDSSKAAPRAWILATKPNVTIVHLYRSAADVISSWRHPKWDKALNGPIRKMSIASAAREWVQAEQMIRILANRRAVQRLNYWHFATEPRRALRKTLGVSYGDVIDTIQWCGESTVLPSASYHSLNGNPDRYDKGRILIRPRKRNMGDLTRVERCKISLLGNALDCLYR